LISYNQGRYDKKLWSQLGEGEKIKLFVGDTEKNEAEFVAAQVDFHHKQKQIPLNDMVVFYRTNAQSRAFEDFLLYKDIPYTIVGGISFYQRREIKDILAFLRISQSGSDYISFVRTINLPKRGIGQATIEKIRSHAQEEDMAVLAYCKALIQQQPLQSILRLSPKQKEGLKNYLAVIEHLQEMSQTSSLHDLVVAAIEKNTLLEFLGRR